MPKTDFSARFPVDLPGGRICFFAEPQTHPPTFFMYGGCSHSNSRLMEKREPFSGSLPQVLGFLVYYRGIGLLGVPRLVDVLGTSQNIGIVFLKIGSSFRHTFLHPQTCGSNMNICVENGSQRLCAPCGPLACAGVGAFHRRCSKISIRRRSRPTSTVDISRRHPSIAKRLRRFVEATHRAAEKALWDHGPLILPGSGVPLPDFPGFGALCLKGAVSPELGTPEASFTTLLNGVIIHI